MDMVCLFMDHAYHGKHNRFVICSYCFLFKFFQLKNNTSLLAFSVIIITILLSNETSSIDRFVNTTKAVVTLDADKVIVADHSASFRIVPIMVLSQKVGISTLDVVLGHGVDTIGKFLYKYLPCGGDSVSGGGFFYIWYEYGFLAFFLLLFTFKDTVYKGQLINYIFLFFLVFLNGLNSQIVWLFVILLYTLNYFSKNKILDMEIPKIIHYCWFGPKTIPALELKCIESWKKFLEI